MNSQGRISDAEAKRRAEVAKKIIAKAGGLESWIAKNSKSGRENMEAVTTKRKQRPPRKSDAIALSEHQEQVQLVMWWQYACHSFGLPQSVFFAIPNGGARNPIVGKKLKDEGVRAGAPDIMVATPRQGYHGLFIELKRENAGYATAVQKQMHEMLRNQGYRVEVCRGWIKAKEVIEDYCHGN